WTNNANDFEADLQATFLNGAWEPLALEYGATTEFVTPDQAGNTPGQARDLGSLAGTQTVHNWVGTANTNDYYRFTLSAPGSVSLRLDGLAAPADDGGSGNADLYLLDSSGIIVLAGSTNAGVSADAIERNLAAGTYYVQIVPIGYANTNYLLTLTR